LAEADGVRPATKDRDKKTASGIFEPHTVLRLMGDERSDLMASLYSKAMASSSGEKSSLLSLSDSATYVKAVSRVSASILSY
jgi:hypothetical protein